ncbi:hypothetical protein ACNUDN_22190 [Mycobacterium sp. smrl_JER01]|uniref:hypothetical protein n=1 Tax=Mycobacterium sp. smrl_JER01 TaxID=3402633 RepID=UPI003AC5EA81
MAFKLTYSDGQESQHDDDTVWEIDDGVLKLGRKKGHWSVLLSPSHWAVIELVDGARDSTDEKSDGGDPEDRDSKDRDPKDRDPKDRDSDSDDDGDSGSGSKDR